VGKHPKRPRDFAQLGKLIVDIATGATQDAAVAPETRKAAAGRKGGLRGGKARASSLSPRKRREIAKKAAAARWKRPT
jgi:hypothetical protein